MTIPPHRGYPSLDACGYARIIVRSARNEICRYAADEKLREIREQGAAALEKGLGFLAKGQGKDGGWHSQTYGQFKGGAALTTFVLDAVSRGGGVAEEAGAGPWSGGLSFSGRGLPGGGPSPAPTARSIIPPMGRLSGSRARRRLEAAGGGADAGGAGSICSGRSVPRSGDSTRKTPATAAGIFWGRGMPTA